jgi:hypothetical protein
MSGSILKAWGTDKSKEKDGVWVDVAVNDDDTIARIKVLRMGQSNRDFTKRFATLGKKFRMMRGDKAKLEQKALMEAFSETCIVQWENIENINEATEGSPKDKYMAFLPANAINLFTAVPDLFDFVVGQAIELETFQSESDKELGKN